MTTFQDVPIEVQSNFISKFLTIRDLCRIRRVNHNFDILSEKSLSLVNSFGEILSTPEELRRHLKVLAKCSQNLRKINIVLYASPQCITTVKKQLILVMTNCRNIMILVTVAWNFHSYRDGEVKTAPHDFALTFDSEKFFFFLIRIWSLLIILSSPKKCYELIINHWEIIFNLRKAKWKKKKKTSWK